jgi:hypothetical protein
MAELDKSRDLTFDRGWITAADGTPGLGITIPITAATPEWSAAFHQLALEQQVDVRLTRKRKRDELLLQVWPGTSREELLRRLNQTLDLINRASQLERDQQRDLLSATSPLEEVALDWWQRG